MTDFKCCPTCTIVKPREHFARWKYGRDGLQTQCKMCNAAYRKTAAYKRTDRSYSQSDKGRSTQQRADRKRRDADPRKHRARGRFGYAVRSGRIVRKPCERCGAEDTQGHHYLGYDAAHAFDVRWLCVPCHRAEHHAEGAP